MRCGHATSADAHKQLLGDGPSVVHGNILHSCRELRLQP